MPQRRGGGERAQGLSGPSRRANAGPARKECDTGPSCFRCCEHWLLPACQADMQVDRTPVAYRCPWHIHAESVVDRVPTASGSQWIQSESASHIRSRPKRCRRFVGESQRLLVSRSATCRWSLPGPM